MEILQIEWSSGNTSLSCSRCSTSWFKSHSLKVIINVRCSLITKIEWSSGNTLLSCSDVPDVFGSNPTHSFLFIYLYISACVHPVYILRVITNVAVWLRRVSGLVEILDSLSPEVLGSNPTHSFFFLYLPVSILKVIINVTCSFITKIEWSSGNTSDWVV